MGFHAEALIDETFRQRRDPDVEAMGTGLESPVEWLVRESYRDNRHDYIVAICRHNA
jgi:hypothetical protein